jgi:predicted regulator of Ras-like GTPase activity (Roadblock/LC7/MglB family)
MLSDVLDEVARRLPEFRGAALVGLDGMPLALLAAADGPDLDLFAAEAATLLKQVAGSGSQEAAGPLRTLVTVGERWHLVLGRVTDEYFLLLVVGSAAPVGQARYELDRATPLILAEID